jgi:hypothetical protein
MASAMDMDGMTAAERRDFEMALEASLREMNIDENEEDNGEEMPEWEPLEEADFKDIEKSRKSLIEEQNAAYQASLEADRLKELMKQRKLQHENDTADGYEGADEEEQQHFQVSSIPPTRDELRQLRAGFLNSLKLNKV